MKPIAKSVDPIAQGTGEAIEFPRYHGVGFARETRPGMWMRSGEGSLGTIRADGARREEASQAFFLDVQALIATERDGSYS